MIPTEPGKLTTCYTLRRSNMPISPIMLSSERATGQSTARLLFYCAYLCTSVDLPRSTALYSFFFFPLCSSCTSNSKSLEYLQRELKKLYQLDFLHLLPHICFMYHLLMTLKSANGRVRAWPSLI